MKLIIAGSRTIELTPNTILGLFQHYYLPLGADEIEVVSGRAQGVDRCGELFAKAYSFPLRVFPADWDRHGKAAGPMRNFQMAEYADALLLIWDGKSKGSANMKVTMKRLKKPIYEVILK